MFTDTLQDSVPKFTREPKYASILRERNLDGQLGNGFLAANGRSDSGSFDQSFRCVTVRAANCF